MRSACPHEQDGVYDLIAYHLGWIDEDGTPVEGGSGKMVRSHLCFLAASGYGDPGCAAKAAAAMELVHAFSLIHDDIEDGDTERRHRPTLWALHGVPLALNAGDGLFALALKTITLASESLPHPACIRAIDLFVSGALKMIEGQHWDIDYEGRPRVSLDQYEAMAVRKTGALLGTSLALGAIFSGADSLDERLLFEAGQEMGLAFQAVDDALAIWGDPELTGKAVGNDLQRGKKSLPVVLQQALYPARRGGESSFEAMAADSNIRLEISHYATEHAQRARDLIGKTAMSPEAREELSSVIDFILQREI
ncbi:MAG TPA: polyprenyl synthetase family protein [Dehalococcoidia bacterium]|nr:polyprenyl synthetase family protein [Dehalococcoidia bacterium]